MTRLVLTLAAFGTLLVGACDSPPANVRTITPPPSPTATATTESPTPQPSPSVIKNADYPGKGKVTKINMEMGSVEMDHEEIVGVMPPMRMEFYVSDKKLLEGIKVGDAIDFTLRYKDGTETIVAIGKRSDRP